MNIRQATIYDAEFLLRCRNESRENYFDSKELALEEHTKWLRSKLTDLSTFIYIGEIVGEPIGYVRGWNCGEDWELSWGVVRCHRGVGLGTNLLRGVLALHPDRKWKANIKASNTPSLKIATKLGIPFTALP